MNHLKEKRGTSILLITHDLGVVAKMADRIAVMYAGKIVEYGDARQVFYRPSHPYTWGLLGAMPNLIQDVKSELYAIPGTPPDLYAPPKGCAFAARCPYAMEACLKEDPPEFACGQGHGSRCWLLDPRAPDVTPAGGAFRPCRKEAVIMSDAILQVSNLEKHFRVGRGKTLGLVGRVRLRQATVGRTLLRIYEPDGGTIVFDGQDISKVTRPRQGPDSKDADDLSGPLRLSESLFTVGEIIAEGLELHKLCANAKERRERVYELLNMVGLSKEHANRFPHEFSGGQRSGWVSPGRWH